MNLVNCFKEILMLKATVLIVGLLLFGMVSYVVAESP